jgi:8-oxo-dGTP diphosphatase
MRKPDRYPFFATVHIFLLRGEQLLMLRRFNTGFEDGKYSVVAGHLDGGETVRQGAMREAREEAGVEINPDTLQVVGVIHRNSDHERIDFFLAATEWQGEPTNLEPQFCDDLCWAPLDALPENTIPYVRRAIENYLGGIWFDEYGWD